MFVLSIASIASVASLGLSQNFSLDLPSFDKVLTSPNPAINGHTIEQITTNGHPLFSPIEGLPDDVWKGKQCRDCHNWTRRDLCIQGNSYLLRGVPAKRHPLGGEFKEILQFWVETGCN